jgi:amino acid permease
MSLTLLFLLGNLRTRKEKKNFFLTFFFFNSVLSAANSSLYTTARTLLGLASDGNAPAIFARVNRFGSPYM